MGPGPDAEELNPGCVGGVCCREELRTAGVHVHLGRQPMEPACHPFHVPHGTGAGELAGEVLWVGGEAGGEKELFLA